eukprot:767227-Hanusia_phi.AAC.4
MSGLIRREGEVTPGDDERRHESEFQRAVLCDLDPKNFLLEVSSDVCDPHCIVYEYRIDSGIDDAQLSKLFDRLGIELPFGLTQRDMANDFRVGIGVSLNEEDLKTYLYFPTAEVHSAYGLYEARLKCG